VGPAARHRGRAAPGRGQLRRPLQQLMAPSAPRPPHTQGGLPGSTISSSSMTRQTTNLSKRPGAVHRPEGTRRQARLYSAAGVGHRYDSRVRAACGRSSLTPGPGRMVPRRAHRAGPIAELLGGGSELTRCPRHRLIGRAYRRPCPTAPPTRRRTRWPDRAGAGGLPAQRRHNKMRAHGHASDLPERTPRDPSLHLTAPYAIPPLSCGNTLQPGAARGVASGPLPPDTEGVTGSNPVAPTTRNRRSDPV
jgi:hypothetical protein